MDKVSIFPDGISRCKWCASAPEYIDYHDNEWGYPVRDDIRLFEKICLEGFQSGLSWITILRKREGFRNAFAGFDFYKIAQFDENDIERLVNDANIVRHRGKIEATINNAKRVIEIIEEYGSFSDFIWSFEPPHNEHGAPQTASVSETSVRLSKLLKKKGWKFVGPTTIFAFMQAMGLINDHAIGCDIREKVKSLPHI
jgi:DNA-3-methyladenine glycosylase I